MKSPLNQARFNDSITSQLLKVIFGLYLIVAVVVTVIQMYVEYIDVKDTINEELKSFQVTAGPGITNSLWSINDKLLLSILSGVLENPIVTGVQVYDENKKLYLEVGTFQEKNGKPEDIMIDGQTTDQSPPAPLFYKPFGHSFPVIYIGPEKVSFNIGAVKIYSNNKVVIDRVKYGFILIIINSVIKTLALWLIFIFFIHKLLGKPLQKLTDSINQVNYENLQSSKIKIDTPAGNELSILADTFNEMVNSLYLATDEVKQREKQLHTVIETIPDLVWLKNKEGEYLACNTKFERLFGAKESEIIGKTDYDFVTKELADFFRKHDKKTMDAGCTSLNEEEVTYADDGHRELLETSKTPMFDQQGQLVGVLGVGRDITDRRQSEQALRRAQKMDAIGQLTGGIAHDFNNILGIIIGNLSFLKNLITNNEKAQKRVVAIAKAAQRAANLTRQLLAFSRKQGVELKQVNINKLIQNMDSLITRSITPEVQVDSVFSQELWLTKIDPNDFEDALLNLVLNARDAMPNGGSLTIETHNKILDAAYCSQNPGVSPGSYVLLIVSDTGTGISFEHKEKIFEPFFTTKPKDKGTGLGLSMVFGFTSRSNGHIKVYSELGVGTTFRLYLPLSEGEVHQSDIADFQPEQFLGGSETILAVDDEEELLEITSESLRSLGYQVLTACDGKQALQQLAKYPAISLLFSDVVMPGGINGYELAEQASTNRPDLKILLTSGYTDKAVAHNGQARFYNNLLSKPYTQAELAQRVRSVLGELKNTESGTNESELMSSIPAAIEWTDTLSLGINSIDEDHKALIDLLNRCLQLETNTDNKEQMAAILTELIDYTQYHFQREKAIMKACGYPGVVSHCKVHQFLIKQVEDKQRQIQQNHLSRQELLSFLTSWLVDHIQGMDQAIAPYAKGKDELITKTLAQLDSDIDQESS